MSSKNFGLFGYRFKCKGDYLTYKSIYGKKFRVRLKDIETVTVDLARASKGTLKVIGHGTVLAQVTLPRSWAEKAQTFILNNLDRAQTQ